LLRVLRYQRLLNKRNVDFIEEERTKGDQRFRTR